MMTKEQECPKCQAQFKLLNYRNSASLGQVETLGHAKFCPFCAVQLDSWEAWIDKEVLIIKGDEVERPVILKCVNDWNTFDVCNQETGETFEVDSQFVFTQN